MFAERDVSEVVVGAVRAERVHERAGFDVAVGAGERAAVDVAGAAGERERPVDDGRGGVVDERLGGLRLGEQRAELSALPSDAGFAARCSRSVSRAREDAAGGGEVDRVRGDLHPRARIAVDPPGKATACELVRRLGIPSDAEA